MRKLLLLALSVILIQPAFADSFLNVKEDLVLSVQQGAIDPLQVELFSDYDSLDIEHVIAANGFKKLDKDFAWEKATEPMLLINTHVKNKTEKALPAAVIIPKGIYKIKVQRTLSYSTYYGPDLYDVVAHVFSLEGLENNLKVLKNDKTEWNSLLKGLHFFAMNTHVVTKNSAPYDNIVSVISRIGLSDKLVVFER